jgi:hypothetical protein
MPKQHEVERKESWAYPYDEMAVEDWFEHPAQMALGLVNNFRSGVSMRGRMSNKTFSVKAERVSPRSKLYKVTVTRTR